MAPELMEKSLEKANFATDVYSLTMTFLVISFHYQLVKIIANEFRVGNIHGGRSV